MSQITLQNNDKAATLKVLAGRSPYEFPPTVTANLDIPAKDGRIAVDTNGKANVTVANGDDTLSVLVYVADQDAPQKIVAGASASFDVVPGKPLTIGNMV